MPFVTLQFPEGVLDENPEEMSWLQCASKQTTEDIDLAVLEALEDGDCLALFDRNCFTEEWSANSRVLLAIRVLRDGVRPLFFSGKTRHSNWPLHYVSVVRNRAFLELIWHLLAVVRRWPMVV